ncbi:hypothetical protein SEA_HITCHHIKER_7 [Microbacterium phage HitchHiker]
MAEMKNFNGEILEQRDCFKKDAHGDHKWHDLYYCSGRGLDTNGYVIPDRLKEMTREEFKDTYMDETTPAPGILDGRAAYGNRVINMRQQADMWNAYLDGRHIEAHDVPIMFVLTKLHRLGRMPDYADNYNDIDGYMQIAREVIGTNMVEAATAKEYSQLKAVRDASTNVVEAKAVQAWLADHGVVSDVVTVDHSVPPRHPYENVERDAERDAMDGWVNGKPPAEWSTPSATPSQTIMGSDGRDHSA